MYQEIIDLLFHPGIFFERRNREKISLVIPAIIVGIGGVVSFLSPLIERAVINRGDLVNFIIMPSAAVFFLVFPIILWLGVAGIFHGICRFFSGTGSFPATLQNCGYGYLPQTLFSPLIIIHGVASTRVSGMQPPIILMVTVAVAGAAMFLGLFWSAALWTVAMEKTQGVSRYRAIIGPVLVVLLSLIPLLLVIITDYPAPVPPP
jgi:hypothetical protein